MQDKLQLAGSRDGLVQQFDGSIQKEMTIQDLGSLLQRRKVLSMAVFAAVVLAAAFLFATQEKMYKATAEIQVQKDSADALSLNTMMGQSEAGDAVESNITLQTEAQILQSDSLALSVIKALDLEESPDFKAHFSAVGWVLGVFAPAGATDLQNVNLEDAPGRRSHAVSVFAANLKIKPISGTRLISIEYYSSDPKTAAAVVNLLVQNLIDYNFVIRHDATSRASAWLVGQLSDLRKQSEALQTRVVEQQHGTGMYMMGQTDSQGHEQVYTPVLDRLQQATSQLTQAQSARIMKGALYQVVKDGDPELISGLAGNSTLSGASAGLSGSLLLLQNLRTQESQTQAQLNELSNKFGSSYPKIGDMRASLETTQKAIAAESARIAARVQNDYTVSQRVESQDRTVFEQEKAQAQSLNDKAVGYEILRQEATQTRNLYENLLGRLKEADLVAGLHSTNITLVDAARVPARPAKPSLILYAGAGLGGGLLLSMCAALYRDATDGRIQDFSELKSLSHEAPFAFLPHHAGHHVGSRVDKAGLAGTPFQRRPDISASRVTTKPRAMVAAIEPRAAFTEALRTLRTSLMQNSSESAPPQVVLVTSSVPGEGKSMLSLNLAIVYVQSGKKVLLVDGDLRTPVLHRRLRLPNDAGLTDLLSQDEEIKTFAPLRVPVGDAFRLHVIPAGPMTEFPAEMLASEEMEHLVKQWRGEYDYIFIDGAPLLPVTDSALLGRYADFTLLVARHNMTDRRSLERSCDILRSQGVHKTGIVLNGVRSSSGAQYRYYGYNPTTYQGSEMHV